MATLVGTQASFTDALKELIELDYDASEAYAAAINRLTKEEYKNTLTSFMEDHKRHIQELSSLLAQHNEEYPKGPSTLKQWLTKGKVVIADLAGDDAIISAMVSNEEDTNTAYETLNARDDKWQDAEDILQRGLADERRHKKWLKEQIE